MSWLLLLLLLLLFTVVNRLFSDETPDVITDCVKAQISPPKNSMPNISQTDELGCSVLSSSDGSIERRRGSVDTSLSASRPAQPLSGVSRPGRDGIKLNSDVSRTASLMRRFDSVSSDSQALSSAHSYVDKFNEFLTHGWFAAVLFLFSKAGVVSYW